MRCAANRHAHGAVPDYIIDYRSKRTCSIGYLSRFQDFGQDFKISGEISRFRARFQDFRQDFRDFKISGKISRFQARFQDFMQDFKISCKISIETYEISRVSDPSARPSDTTRRKALRRVATKLSHCEWEIAPRRVVSLRVARIDSSSILASCRARFCRTRSYHDRKLVAKMEEQKQIESVRDQFPMLPFPYKSNNTLHRIVIIVHAEWVEPEQVQSSV